MPGSKHYRPPRRWTEAEAARHMAFYGSSGAERAPTERPNRQRVVSLLLPFPPTTNHDKAPNGSGGHILTAATQSFREAVNAVVLAQRSPWVVGPYVVAITLYPPDRRAYDLDNRIKPTLDALQHAGVIDNDRAVKRLIISEATISAGGECHVIVEARDEPVPVERAA